MIKIFIGALALILCTIPLYFIMVYPIIFTVLIVLFVSYIVGDVILEGV